VPRTDSLPLRQFDSQLAGAVKIQLKRMTSGFRWSIPQARLSIGTFIFEVPNAVGRSFEIW
jgi:hypothetical protein